MREMSKTPRVTYALIAINVLAFLGEGGHFSPTSSGLRGNVADESFLSREAIAEAHQYWRLITSGFVHENLLHIGFNMYVLYVLGSLLEPALGSVKFAVIYGVSLLTGSLGALLVSPHVLTVGASGAVFGVMGAAAVEMRARQIPLMQSGVGGLILLNLILSFTFSNISWGGHVGGLIGGAVTAEVLRQGDRRRSQALAYAGCALIALGSVSGAIATANSSKVEPVGAGPVGGLVNPAP